MSETPRKNKLGEERRLQFLVDDLIARGTVNLIVGNTGAGKTMFSVWEFLWNNIAGRPVMGRKSTGYKACYVSLDRAAYSFDDTLWRLSIPRDAFPWECRPGKKMDVKDIQRFVAKHSADLVIIDGIELCPPHDERTGYPTASTLALWLGELGRMAQASKFTVIGIGQAAKIAPGGSGGAREVRHMMAGSMRWGAGTETIIAIEKRPDQTRRVLVADHAGADIELTYAFNAAGEMTVVESETEFVERQDIVDHITQGEIYTKAGLVKVLVNAKICKRTKGYEKVEKLLFHWKSQGLIITGDSDHFSFDPAFFEV